jgi:hypothetical protein
MREAGQQRQQQSGTSASLQAEGLAWEPPPRHLLVPDGGRVHLLLHEQAEAADCILGYMHACLLLHEQHSMHSGGGSGGGGGSCEVERIRRMLQQARRLLPGLLRELEAAGWDDQKVVLEAKKRRYTW